MINFIINFADIRKTLQMYNLFCSYPNFLKSAIFGRIKGKCVNFTAE